MAAEYTFLVVKELLVLYCALALYSLAFYLKWYVIPAMKANLAWQHHYIHRGHDDLF